MQQYIGIQNITAHVMICAAVHAVLDHHIECILTPFLSGALPYLLLKLRQLQLPSVLDAWRLPCTLQTIRTPKPVVPTPPVVLAPQFPWPPAPHFIWQCANIRHFYFWLALPRSSHEYLQYRYIIPLQYPCQADSLARFDLST
jgi:hypothetical protein